jgi:D-alanyl-D-alanine carboxypeptidase
VRNTTFTHTGSKTIPVKNSNDLLHSYSECTGMKAGFTKAAGRCLVASATRREKTVLAVILGSTMEDVWDDAEVIDLAQVVGLVMNAPEPVSANQRP